MPPVQRRNLSPTEQPSGPQARPSATTKLPSEGIIRSTRASDLHEGIGSDERDYKWVASDKKTVQDQSGAPT